MEMVLALVVASVVGLAAGGGVAVVIMRRGEARAEGDRAAQEAALQRAVSEAVAAVGGDAQAHLQEAVRTLSELSGDRVRTASESVAQQADLRERAFTERVEGVQRELDKLTGLVGDLREQRAEQHGTFQERMEEALRRTSELAATTEGLRVALANSRARGQWGERLADDVLRAAGLVEGVSFVKQRPVAGGGRPDVTFLLPQGLELHMDVKFPVDNYLRVVEAGDDRARAESTAAFLRDVRARVKEVAGRGYADPATTPGWVLLFIPNEAVYGFVHEHDHALFDVALEHGVVMCSPFTLFAVLAVVRRSVESFRLARTSDEILECLQGFTKQWESFTDVMDKLGKQLGTVQGTFDSLSGTRRRQLERELDRIERLQELGPDALDDRELGPADDSDDIEADDDELDDDESEDPPAAATLDRGVLALRPLRAG